MEQRAGGRCGGDGGSRTSTSTYGVPSKQCLRSGSGIHHLLYHDRPRTAPAPGGRASSGPRARPLRNPGGSQVIAKTRSATPDVPEVADALVGRQGLEPWTR